MATPLLSESTTRSLKSKYSARFEPTERVLMTTQDHNYGRSISLCHSPSCTSSAHFWYPFSLCWRVNASWPTKPSFLAAAIFSTCGITTNLQLPIQRKVPSSHSIHMIAGEQGIMCALMSLFVEFNCMSRVRRTD